MDTTFLDSFYKQGKFEIKKTTTSVSHIDIIFVFLICIYLVLRKQNFDGNVKISISFRFNHIINWVMTSKIAQYRKVANNDLSCLKIAFDSPGTRYSKTWIIISTQRLANSVWLVILKCESLSKYDMKSPIQPWESSN